VDGAPCAVCALSVATRRTCRWGRCAGLRSRRPPRGAIPCHGSPSRLHAHCRAVRGAAAPLRSRSLVCAGGDATVRHRRRRHHHRHRYRQRYRHRSHPCCHHHLTATATPSRPPAAVPLLVAAVLRVGAFSALVGTPRLLAIHPWCFASGTLPSLFPHAIAVIVRERCWTGFGLGRLSCRVAALHRLCVCGTWWTAGPPSPTSPFPPCSEVGASCGACRSDLVQWVLAVATAPVASMGATSFCVGAG